MGEPAGGGGAWGFRTEELFQAFLKKYKPKWPYHMGYSVKDFYATFGKLLQQLEMRLESALESTLEVERKLASFGHRCDRYDSRDQRGASLGRARTFPAPKV